MAGTAIEWADKVWNPLVGCSRVSEGCRNCYAERQAFRAAAMGIARYDGLTKKIGGEIRWTGEVRLVESGLALPLQWRKPARIFVNSMSDLFHESVDAGDIDRIFDVMVEAEQHTFLVLTKRPARMRDYVTRWLAPALLPKILSHIHLGVSVEDQASADERIPILMRTPAVTRWVSYEPALGPVHFRSKFKSSPRIDWIVVGGESGPGARPFDLEWARDTIRQARDASEPVPVFVKQLGALPWTHEGDVPLLYRTTDPARYFHDYDGSGVYYGAPPITDRKGGDMAEWPEDLRVRECPT